MLGILKNNLFSSVRGRSAKVLEQRLALTQSFLSEVPGSVYSPYLKKLADDLNQQANLTPRERVKIFFVLADLYRYYEQPKHRLSLVDEMLRYMHEFRVETGTYWELTLFKESLKQQPLDVLKMFRFEIKELDHPNMVAYINGAASEWVIYFNLNALKVLVNLHPYDVFASHIEYTILHELTHLLQFQLKTSVLKLMKEHHKPWDERTHEREAFYVSERVFRSILYTKGSYLPFARQTVKEVAYKSSYQAPLLFKEGIFIPYHQKLEKKLKTYSI